MKNKAREFLQEYFSHMSYNIDWSKHEGTEKLDDIGVDSLDLVEVILEFEHVNAVSIHDERIESVQTKDDLESLLNQFIK